MTFTSAIAHCRRTLARVKVLPSWPRIREIWEDHDSGEDRLAQNPKQLATGILVASLFAVALSRTVVVIESRARCTRSAVQPSTKPRHPRGPSRAVAALHAGEPIDINEATTGDLELLPGIGPSLASRLVAYRAKHGRFRSTDDLIHVLGIGPKMLKKMQIMTAVLDEETTEPQRKDQATTPQSGEAPPLDRSETKGESGTDVPDNSGAAIHLIAQ